jgi:uncharacterized membrane-anchored protein YhcB (DUF1043 family)
MSDQPLGHLVFAEFQRELFRRLDTVDRRFEGLETRIYAWRDEVYGHVDGVYHRLDRLATDYEDVKGGLARLDQRLGPAPGPALAAEVAELRERVDGLQARLEAIEERLPR